MLQRLRIKNLAVIEEIEIEFEQGLNLFTGETGAGKSIIIDALSLLFGGRTDTDLIRTSADYMFVEGVFALRAHAGVSDLLHASGIESDGETIVIKRELKTDGRSRGFINGSFATTRLLKDIGSRFVEIHGQHQQQRLLARDSHLLALDAFAGTTERRHKIESIFNDMESLRKQLEAIRQDEKLKAQKIDILQFQISELESAALELGEEEKLQQEREILSNAEMLFRSASEAYSQLHEEEQNIVSRLKAVKKNLAVISEIDPSFQEDFSQTESSIYNFQETAYKLQDFSEKAAPDANRLEVVENRLALIHSLKKKYGSTIPEMLDFLEDACRELEELNTSEEKEAELEKKLDETKALYVKEALELSSKRRGAALGLREEMEKHLKMLAMERTEFSIEMQDVDTDLVIGYDGKEYRPGLLGLEEVEFYIAPNIGETPRPLAKIASGGELSRIMLALESAINDDKTDRTVIFDEVDVGIGGRVAEIVGRKMRLLSYNQQVVCVTHLPQVAAYATTHFSISKTVRLNRTFTIVEKIAGEARVQEIARMLGGINVTDTTLQQAREFIQKSY